MIEECKRAGVAAVLFLVSAGVLSGSERGAVLSGSEEWEMAGINRENAAFHMQSEADRLMDSAQLEVCNNDSEPSARRAELLHATARLIEAGGLYGATVGNLDRAADNWEKSAAGYGKARQDDRAQASRDRAAQARVNALIACQLAAECYEKAAAIYVDSQVNQTARAARASEKAASWREKLAARK